ncbi:MAG: polysaccharide pyruvyl transferase family protein [Leptolyngbyaceae cyanobacterium bins.59]|nr:polysaccharide pyruvyl transferase family protein [Leptolyngbyaceae cyanobacterium bins.59]
MQVGLINTYSTANLGDAAIYSALASMASGSIVAAIPNALPKDSPKVHLMEQLPRCEGYISVGGDIFNNAREAFVTRRFLQNLWPLATRPNQTIVFGQSIPRSCRGFSFQMLTQVFRRLAAVTVRDAVSYERLKRAGVNARLSFDTAFALEVTDGAKAAARSIFSTLGVNPEHAALFSLRNFETQMYQHDQHQVLGKLVSLCRTLQKRGHHPVVLIQAKVDNADSDMAIADLLSREVPQLSIFNPFLSSLPFPAWEIAMGALAISRLIIGIRYHTAVLALASDRMPFNLFYSNKGEDLTQRLQIPGCNLKDFDPDLSVDLIEKTGEMDFNSVPLRNHVKDDFDYDYRKLTN